MSLGPHEGIDTLLPILEDKKGKLVLMGGWKKDVEGDRFGYNTIVAYKSSRRIFSSKCKVPITIVNSELCSHSAMMKADTAKKIVHLKEITASPITHAIIEDFSNWKLHSNPDVNELKDIMVADVLAFWLAIHPEDITNDEQMDITIKDRLNNEDMFSSHSMLEKKENPESNIRVTLGCKDVIDTLCDRIFNFLSNN